MIEQQALAPIGKRIAGGFVDLAITLIAAVFALFTWGFLEGTIGAYTTAENWKGRGYLVGTLIDCALTCYFMTRDEQATLGQRMLGIKTIKDNGTQIEIGTALARYVVSIFSSLLLKIGFITALFSKNKRTWHDMAAGTLVVNQDYQRKESIYTAPIEKIYAFHPAEEIDEPIPPKIVEAAKITTTTNKSENQILIPPTMLNDEDLWEKALDEYESQERRKGLWAKLFAEYDGDDSKIKVQYLKVRVIQLKEEYEQDIKNKTHEFELHKQMIQIKQDEENKRKSVEQCISEYIYEIKNHGSNKYLLFPNGQSAVKHIYEYKVYESEVAVKEALDKYAETELFSKKGLVFSVSNPTSDIEIKNQHYVDILIRKNYRYIGFDINSENSFKWCFEFESNILYFDEQRMIEVCGN